MGPWLRDHHCDHAMHLHHASLSPFVNHMTMYMMNHMTMYMITLSVKCLACSFEQKHDFQPSLLYDSISSPNCGVSSKGLLIWRGKLGKMALQVSRVLIFSVSRESMTIMTIAPGKLDEWCMG